MKQLGAHKIWGMLATIWFGVLSSHLSSRNEKVKVNKTIILPFLLYGCEMWSVTLRAQHGLRVFENRVLRRICGSKRDDVTGERTKLHNEELHNLYSSQNIISYIKSTRMKWVGHVARVGEETKVYKALMEKPEGNRLIGRSRRRQEDGIRMDLGETGWGACEADSTGSGHGPVTSSCKCGKQFSGSSAMEVTAMVG
jgi:hypothetical protein